MQPLKDIYTNKDIFQRFSKDFKKAYPPLKQDAFYRALTKDLETLELKARLERTSDVCHQFLPKGYTRALAILYRFCEGKDNKLIYLFLPTFVSKYGQHDYERSIKALRDFTQYSSSEEGVRVYLEQNLTKTLQHMLQWTKSKNVHIRRLASEGCRPRLPWAKKVQALIDDPRLAWPILEALKTDSEKYVQKSVANHINDISKDHPDWIVVKVNRWDRSHPATQWIVQHGMRSLIKRGHKGALKLFGHDEKPSVKLQNIRWDKKLKMGKKWTFSLDVVSEGKKAQALVIDYRIYFCKKNKIQKPKTFKLKKYKLLPKETLPLTAKYTFKDMSTRKHYSGEHMWQLLINGESFKRFSFDIQ